MTNCSVDDSLIWFFIPKLIINQHQAKSLIFPLFSSSKSRLNHSIQMVSHYINCNQYNQSHTTNYYLRWMISSFKSTTTSHPPTPRGVQRRLRRATRRPPSSRPATGSCPPGPPPSDGCGRRPRRGKPCAPGLVDGGIGWDETWWISGGFLVDELGDGMNFWFSGGGMKLGDVVETCWIHQGEINGEAVCPQWASALNTFRGCWWLHFGNLS